MMLWVRTSGMRWDSMKLVRQSPYRRTASSDRDLVLAAKRHGVFPIWICAFFPDPFRYGRRENGRFKHQQGYHPDYLLGNNRDGADGACGVSVQCKCWIEQAAHIWHEVGLVPDVIVVLSKV